MEGERGTRRPVQGRAAIDSEDDVAESGDPWLPLAVAIISIVVLAYLGLENTHTPCMTDMVYRVTVPGCNQGP